MFIIWTPGDINDAPILFGGVTYTPLPIEFGDMKTVGQGTAPAPTIEFSAMGGLISGLLASFGDLVGAKITRMRTFRDCLDGQPNADPTAF